MDESYSTKRLLVLRKLTRAVADLLRGQLKDYLATLSPLLRPRAVLGDYVQGATKETVKGSEAAFKELQSLYETVAGSKPFNLPRELKPPLEVLSSGLEITPTEYAHAARTDRESKTVTVTSPLQWVLSFSGYAPKRLNELRAERSPTGNDVQQFVLHYLMLHAVMTRQTGVTKILEALHFPVSSGRLPALGDLPVVFITCTVATVRPPDDVIIESTEISGMDAFEEVVDVGRMLAMRDPLHERLLEIVKSQGDELLSQARASPPS
jgi:hypothetical protein